VAVGREVDVECALEIQGVEKRSERHREENDLRQGASMVDADIVVHQEDGEVGHGEAGVTDDGKRVLLEDDVWSDGGVDAEVDAGDGESDSELKPRLREDQAQEGGEENASSDVEELPEVPLTGKAAPEKFKPENSGLGLFQLLVAMSHRFPSVVRRAAEVLDIDFLLGEERDVAFWESGFAAEEKFLSRFVDGEGVRQVEPVAPEDADVEHEDCDRIHDDADNPDGKDGMLVGGAVTVDVGGGAEECPGWPVAAEVVRVVRQSRSRGPRAARQYDVDEEERTAWEK